MNNNYYAVIMAGGIGSRFWPVSTPLFPKQFLDLTGSGKSMLQESFDRISSFIPKENIFILTAKDYKNIVKEQLPSLEDKKVVTEPALRNTAPCILYATLKIKQMNPDAVIVASPSDSWIGEESVFKDDILKCMSFCDARSTVATIGIKPTFPSTGYGYIKYVDSCYEAMKQVKKFVEKPDKSTAEEYIQQGGYFWNSGILVWKLRAIEDAYKQFQPKMYETLEFSGYNSSSEEKFIEDNYIKTDNISVDYAILEKIKDIYVCPAFFSWSDLGSWSSLYDKLSKEENNNVVVNSKSFLEDTHNSIFYGRRKKNIVAVGLDNYIVVDTDDTLLIFPKDKDQKIKEVANKVKNTQS